MWPVLNLSVVVAIGQIHPPLGALELPHLHWSLAAQLSLLKLTGLCEFCGDVPANYAKKKDKYSSSIGIKFETF